MNDTSPQYFTPFLLQGETTATDIDATLTLLEQISSSTIKPGQLLLLNQDQERVTIDMVRSLHSELGYASLQGKTRHIVIFSIDKSTREAQNALLKMLEEPPKKTQFWLIATESQMLLPTLLSRCIELQLDAKEHASISQELSNFCSSIGTLSHREIIDWTEQYKERAAALNATHEMIRYFHQELQKKPSAEIAQALTALIQARDHLAANVNPKMALEACLFALKKQLS